MLPPADVVEPGEPAEPLDPVEVPTWTGPIPGTMTTSGPLGAEGDHVGVPPVAGALVNTRPETPLVEPAAVDRLLAGVTRPDVRGVGEATDTLWAGVPGSRMDTIPPADRATVCRGEAPVPKAT